MANHKSALKRHRQNLKRREQNRQARSTIRTSIRATLAEAAAGNFDKADDLAKRSTKLLDKAAIHHLMPKKTVARTISRMHKAINRAKNA